METKKELYYYNSKGIKKTGAHYRLKHTKNIWGDCTNVFGSAKMLSGDVSNIKYDNRYDHTFTIQGDVSKLKGSLNLLTGDVSSCVGDATKYYAYCTGSSFDFDNANEKGINAYLFAKIGHKKWISNIMLSLC